LWREQRAALGGWPAYTLLIHVSIWYISMLVYSIYSIYSVYIYIGGWPASTLLIHSHSRSHPLSPLRVRALALSLPRTCWLMLSLSLSGTLPRLPLARARMCVCVCVWCVREQLLDEPAEDDGKSMLVLVRRWRLAGGSVRVGFRVYGVGCRK